MSDFAKAKATKEKLIAAGYEKLPLGAAIRMPGDSMSLVNAIKYLGGRVELELTCVVPRSNGTSLAMDAWAKSEDIAAAKALLGVLDAEEKHDRDK